MRCVYKEFDICAGKSFLGLSESEALNIRVKILPMRSEFMELRVPLLVAQGAIKLDYLGEEHENT